jgi:hypothetical protein
MPVQHQVDGSFGEERRPLPARSVADSVRLQMGCITQLQILRRLFIRTGSFGPFLNGPYGLGYRPRPPTRSSTLPHPQRPNSSTDPLRTMERW